jgi:hypothetical protein
LFGSGKEKDQAFRSLAPGFPEMLGEDQFVKMHEHYLFLRKSMAVSPGLAAALQGVCQQMIQDSLWGQYALESDELDLKINESKVTSEGLFPVVLKTPVVNETGFTDFFGGSRGYRLFSGPRHDERVVCREKIIAGKDCFWFETGWDLSFFPWHLRNAFFFCEGNEVFIVRAPHQFSAILTQNYFASDFFLKETFATTDPALGKDAFSHTGENGFCRDHVVGWEEEVKSDGLLLTGCLVLSHQYIHPDCFTSGLSRYTDFEMYINRDLEYLTIWQKTRGLIGFVVKEKKNQEVFLLRQHP